jgi:hypothetical protein
MKGTIIVVRKDEGEYDSISTSVEEVYHVDIDNFDFDKEYQQYHLKMFNHYGVPAYIDKYGELRYGEAKRGHIMEMRKIVNQFYKEHGKEMPQKYYIEEILKAEKVNFTTVFL